MDEQTTDSLTVPVPLCSEHDLSQFSSGEPELDRWLKNRAIKNEAQGASRTYVVCKVDSMQVVAYYCLATGAIDSQSVPGNVRRNMPNPIPVMVLGRLAVDQSFQGRGLGKGLLIDAILRTLQAAKIAGIRAIIVHAISESARNFYERNGFKRFLDNEMTLVLRICDVEKTISSS